MDSVNYARNSDGSNYLHMFHNHGWLKQISFKRGLASVLNIGYLGQYFGEM